MENPEVYQRNVELYRERGIILPTIEQMRDPSKIPASILEKLKDIPIQEVNPLNLFRINWHNEPVDNGGLFNMVPNYVRIPKVLSGCDAPIIAMSGKYFPTGAHKVGATYCALVDAITKGTFDPTSQKALWPSTGNYCRGGAYDCALMGCPAIAVLPEGMSRERFDYLKEIGSEIVATPGTESNVWEIYMKTMELVRENPDTIVNFNQFEQFGNCSWHYAVTGPALVECFENEKKNEDERIAASFFTTGSAGSIASSDHLKAVDPTVICVCGEALQCPTIFENGFGAHRIEGIGDKHIPWIHNVHTSDAIACIDDEIAMRTFRLFNEKIGHQILAKHGVPQDVIDKLGLLGISGCANVLGCIKTAKNFELQSHEFVVTCATDSAAMYQSRLAELNEERGEYTELQAELDFEALQNLTNDNFKELTYHEKRRIHNLKYFTWIEQLGKTSEELNDQWYDRKYWKRNLNMAFDLDERIKKFNEDTGLAIHE